MDISVKLRHQRNGRPVCARYKLNRVLRQTGILTTVSDRFRQSHVRSNRFRSASQDDSVASFETKRGRITGHIWPGFVDNPNHTVRHSPLRYFEPVWTGPLPQYLSDRIR